MFVHVHIGYDQCNTTTLCLC